MSDPYLAGLVAIAAALVLTPVAMAVARRTGAVDRPGPLKPQAAPVAYLGGAAVFVAASPWVVADRPALLGPLVGALALGVADDYVGLLPWHRLLGEVAVGAGVAAVVPTRLGEPLGGVLVTATAVLLMNGVNLIDGLDGLASGVLAASFVASAVLLHGSARALAAAAAGALVGFLVYNRPPARVYLGDGGAYVLGTAATVMLASAWAHGERWSTSIAALALVAVPTAEVAFAVVRRLRAGHSVVAGDRRHPYDLLVSHGWHRGSSTLVYVGTEVVLAAVVLLVAGLHSMAGALAVVVVAAAALTGMAGACGALGPGSEIST